MRHSAAEVLHSHNSVFVWSSEPTQTVGRDDATVVYFSVIPVCFLSAAQTQGHEKREHFGEQRERGSQLLLAMRHEGKISQRFAASMECKSKMSGVTKRLAADTLSALNG
jgi:hypothetical protein